MERRRLESCLVRATVLSVLGLGLLCPAAGVVAPKILADAGVPGVSYRNSWNHPDSSRRGISGMVETASGPGGGWYAEQTSGGAWVSVWGELDAWSGSVLTDRKQIFMFVPAEPGVQPQLFVCTTMQKCKMEMPGTGG